MVDFKPTRRQFGLGLAAGVCVPLAGCSGDGTETEDGNEDETTVAEDGDGADDPTETEEPTETDESTETEEPDETETPTADEYALTVTVEDQEGEPIEGATVSVGDTSGETDASGVTDFELASGDYTVSVEAIGYHSGEEDVTIDGDQDVSITLESPEPDGSATFAITPENEDGEPVEIGIDVTVTHGENFEQVTRSYVGDWQGEVEIDGEVNTLGEEHEWRPGRIRAHPITVQYAGEYTVSIEPNEANDFDSVEATVEFSESDLEDQVEKEETFVLDGAKSNEDIEHENAVVMEGDYRFDANHDPFTDWGWGVEDGSTDPGANVVQLEWAEEDHQIWTVEPVDEDGKWHRVVAGHDDNLVWTSTDNEDTEPFNGASVVAVDEWEETDEQLWRIVPLDETHPFVNEGDEAYKVECKATESHAHVAGGEAEPGTSIDTWYYVGAGEMQVLFHEQ